MRDRDIASVAPEGTYKFDGVDAVIRSTSRAILFRDRLDYSGGRKRTGPL